MTENFHQVSVRLLQFRDRTPYSHIEVTGYVIYHANEPDGDSHFNIADTDLGSIAADEAIEDFVVCEIIPEIPVDLPPLHAKITVRGLYRWDIGHGWPEVHPVLSWELAQ